MLNPEIREKLDPPIQYLWDYGYFNCPEALEIDLVRPQDLPSLTHSDHVVQGAARGLQNFMGESYDDIGRALLHRTPEPDGTIGGVTLSLMSEPRCGQPDFQRPGELEEANHPDSCRFELEYSFRMNLSGLTQTQIRAEMDAAIRNWTDEFKFKCTHTLDFERADRYVIAARLGGSVLADQYLAVNRCGVRLRGRFNSSRNWSPNYFRTVDSHEFGHYLGTGHVSDRSALMYPSIHQQSLNRQGRPNSTDIRAIERLGYDRQTGPPDPPDPPDPPTGDWTITQNADGTATITHMGETLTVKSPIIEAGGFNP